MDLAPTRSLCGLFFWLMAGTLFADPQGPAYDPPMLPPSEEEPDHPISEPGPRVSAEPSVEWGFHKTSDGTHPDGNEQQMVWLMNRARTEPVDEGVFLAATGNGRVDSAIDFFDVDVELMMAEFAVIEARPPVAFDRRIYEGSRLHSEDLIARDAQDHDNQFDRVADSGFSANGANASVYSFAQDPVHAHAAFNIDWGNDGGDGSGMQPNRGHRDGIMAESIRTTNVGIAMVPEDDSGTSVGPLVTSIVYARASNFEEDHYNRFLLGTVWEDTNGNERYDPDEGLGGVTVMPNRGTYFAVTAESGGWAIPATEEGEYLVSFSGGELVSPEERNATVAAESVLVVWNPADSFLGIPPETAVVGIQRAEDGFVISWTAESGHTYRVQASTDLIEWTDQEWPVAQEGEQLLTVVDVEEAGAGIFVRVVAVRSE